MKNRLFLKKTKYIAGSVAAAAMVVASCGIGACNDNQVQANRYDTVYLAENDTDAELSDVESEEDSESDIDTAAETDDVVAQLTEGVDIGEKDVYKDETVYAFADASGSTDSVLVSEHLKNPDKKSTLVDKTNLNDIVNLKGDETFTLENDTITWEAGGNDIYYQGTTDEELPVGVKLTYYLGDREVSPEEIAGATGKVKIRVDYENTDGEVPFVAITGMMLGSGFSNVEVTNGKTLSEGDSNIVIGYGVPGLKECLGVEDGDFGKDVTLPDYFEVTADVENFSMEMTVTVVLNASNINLGSDLELSAIDEMMVQLDDATNQLVDGSGQLADGVSMLKEKMGQFNAGVKKLKSGIDLFSNSSGSLVTGVAAINSSTQSIRDGINTLDQGLKTPMTDEEKAAVAAQAEAGVDAQFVAGTDTYNYIYSSAKTSFESSFASDEVKSNVAAAIAGNSNLKAALLPSAITMYVANANAAGVSVDYNNVLAAYNAGDENTVAAVDAIYAGLVKQISDGVLDGVASKSNVIAENTVDACRQAAKTASGQTAVASVESAKKQISDQINAVQPNGYSLVSGTNALAEGTSQLENSVPVLTAGISQLVSGAGELQTGSGQLVDGVTKLDEGASSLDKGMNDYDAQAIEKILGLYNGNVKELITKANAALKASAEYDTFTMLNDGDQGTTKFIIKTEGISAE